MWPYFKKIAIALDARLQSCGHKVIMVQWLALFSPSKKVVGLNGLLATDILNIKPYFNTLPLAFAKCKHIFLHFLHHTQFSSLHPDKCTCFKPGCATYLWIL